MSGRAIRVAVLGAESTGKTTLSAALAASLAQRTGERVAWIAEVLREWCDREGRTPRQDEQQSIADEQHRRIDAAAASHRIVVCDTTALMTAVYSRLVFGDRSLEPWAIERHAAIDCSLVTATDLPWVPDGLQRDGPQVREPVDDALRELLLAHGLPFAVVSGRGSERLERALAAVRPVLRSHGIVDREHAAGTAPPGRGLFARLSDTTQGADAAWRCECCATADYEAAALAQRRDARAPAVAANEAARETRGPNTAGPAGERRPPSQR